MRGRSLPLSVCGKALKALLSDQIKEAMPAPLKFGRRTEQSQRCLYLESHTSIKLNHSGHASVTDPSQDVSYASMWDNHFLIRDDLGNIARYTVNVVLGQNQ